MAWVSSKELNLVLSKSQWRTQGKLETLPKCKLLNYMSQEDTNTHQPFIIHPITLCQI